MCGCKYVSNELVSLLCISYFCLCMYVCMCVCVCVVGPRAAGAEGAEVAVARSGEGGPQVARPRKDGT